MPPFYELCLRPPSQAQQKGAPTGLSDQARRSLFQPTISFKKRGMGLGLSIARKSALLLGGDILLVKGELGGAGFRVLLPSYEANSNSR